MILEFSIGNFLSIKEKVTLSLEAGGISDFPENLFTIGKNRLLRSIAVYGANSSGKSNLLNAIATMRTLIMNSSKMSSTDLLDVTPFLLSTETENKPSFFEMVFFIDGEQFRYGFEASKEKVETEWLFHAKIKAEKMLFIRDGDEIEISTHFREGSKLESKTRPNALFLSVVDQFNGETAKKVIGWFEGLKTISGLDHKQYQRITYKMLKNEATRPALTEFLEKLDLGFKNVEIEEMEFDSRDLPPQFSPDFIRELEKELQGKVMFDFMTSHEVLDENHEVVREAFFRLDEQESSGTQKVFDLVGSVFENLQTGGVLVVDELDAKLHPLLTKAFVGLFNSEQYNQTNAQLIFATHDTNLLSYGNLRRDQIYFTEKKRNGATDLYSLVEYKENGETVRKDRSFEKDYIQGRYGAIPYLGNLGELFSKWQGKQK